MTPRDLIREYPWMDEMLAETLIKAHQNGTLAKHVASWSEPEWKPVQTKVIENAITVLPSEEKSPAPNTADGEGGDL